MPSDQSETTSLSAPVVLHDELVEILAEDMPNRGAAEHAAQMVLDNRGDAIYADLIWNLTNLRHDPEEARRLWKEVLEHKYLVSERLGRNVGVRVAALDYFTNILGKLARPRVIDPAILERLYRDAILDPLTGLSNRRHYRERLSAEMARALRYHNPFVLALFDIDNFKAINDSRGHAAGDEILRQIAEVFRESIRESDLAARWGGEEFALLMPETPKAGAAVVAERIRRRIAGLLERDRVTISGGLASFPQDGDDEERLFAFADRALYQAKSEGKNRICLSAQDRRAYPRLHESLRVRLRMVEPPRQDLDVRTTNVGAGGVAFLHEQPLVVTSQVEGEIEIQDVTSRFFGRIVHVDEVAEGRYDIGIQFLEIDEADRERILSHSV
ncbi:MAG: DUF4032 domain-containing protein [Planctomycetes bacterium]|nr:DUF4032 domain-containing protein [Planctomycetota bacterium]